MSKVKVGEEILKGIAEGTARNTEQIADLTRTFEKMREKHFPTLGEKAWTWTKRTFFGGTAVGGAAATGVVSYKAGQQNPPKPKPTDNQSSLSEFGSGIGNAWNNTAVKTLGAIAVGLGLAGIAMTGTAGMIIAGAGAAVGITYLAGGFKFGEEQPASSLAPTATATTPSTVIAAPAQTMGQSKPTVVAPPPPTPPTPQNPGPAAPGRAGAGPAP